MALLKVSEFASAYGITRTNIYTYAKRNKLIIIDGYIDDDNAINKIFIANRSTSTKSKKPKEKKEQTANVESHIPKDVDLKDTEIYKNTEEKTKSLKSNKPDPMFEEMRRSQALRDEKLQEEIRAAKIKNDRAQEKLIPRDDAGLMVNAYLSRFIMNYMQQTEVLIRESLNECQADNILITRSCSKLVEITNECQEIALKELEIGFKNVAKSH